MLREWPNLTCGRIYDVRSSATRGDGTWKFHLNGNKSKVVVSPPTTEITLEMKLSKAKAAQIIIKELIAEDVLLIKVLAISTKIRALSSTITVQKWLQLRT